MQYENFKLQLAGSIGEELLIEVVQQATKFEQRRDIRHGFASQVNSDKMVQADGVVQIQSRISLSSPESVVSLPSTMFFYYGYNAQPVRSVDLYRLSLKLKGVVLSGIFRWYGIQFFGINLELRTTGYHWGRGRDGGRWRCVGLSI